MTKKEGFLQLPWGKVWYRSVGEGSKPALLVLHGGPGYPSDYLWNLQQLANERQVVFYDQFGCGRSGRSNDSVFWAVEDFVNELRLVREQLGLKSFHLFGHSWGSILATEYVLDRPAGVQSVVFASPCISIQRWLKTTSRHLDELPKPLGEVIRRYELDGRTQAPEYRHALSVYHKTYECRLDPPPQEVLGSNAGFGKEVYEHLWGPNEYTVTGTLKNYDKSSRLGEITLPTLFTCGRYDSASPEACRYYRAFIPRSDLEVFEQSSHMPHLEEPAKYLEKLKLFFKLHD